MGFRTHAWPATCTKGELPGFKLGSWGMASYPNPKGVSTEGINISQTKWSLQYPEGWNPTPSSHRPACAHSKSWISYIRSDAGWRPELYMRNRNNTAILINIAEGDSITLLSSFLVSGKWLNLNAHSVEHSKQIHQLEQSPPNPQSHNILIHQKLWMWHYLERGSICR